MWGERRGGDRGKMPDHLPRTVTLSVQTETNIMREVATVTLDLASLHDSCKGARFTIALRVWWAFTPAPIQGALCQFKG